MNPKNLNVIKIPKSLKSKLSNKKIKRLYDTFEKNFSIQDAFAVAVSGGPDSLALAFLTKIYSIKYNLACKYYVIDHKLRRDSTIEAKKVKRILNRFGIKLEILSWNGKKPSKNIQSLARKKRYDLLISKCKQNKIYNLITGHHLDDLFENFFIRMTRGSGLKGLISFEKETTFASINILRPLLDFEKKKLEFISSFVFNFFVKDPSNESNIFQRVRIRNIINEFKNNGLDKDKLFLTINNLKKSNKALNEYVQQNKELNSNLNYKNKELILNENFFDQPYEVVFRSLSDSLKIIGEKYYSPRGKKIDYILRKITKNTLKKETLGGCVLKKVNRTIIISKEY
ncbi:tRNA lysidine(34) synthetase TilS [Candidatus Pelagibacter sp.]|nr:tRNA lysidine(34) synthetase TilS [Candidatus Pelagibacter sp.]